MNGKIWDFNLKFWMKKQNFVSLTFTLLDGPDGNQNRDQHASLALLILIEFLEKIYSYVGWRSPKILTWSLLTQPTGADKRNPDLVQAFERNAEMRTIVKSVLTDEDATDKRKCFRKLATTRR